MDGNENDQDTLENKPLVDLDLKENGGSYLVKHLGPNRASRRSQYKQWKQRKQQVESASTVDVLRVVEAINEADRKWDVLFERAGITSNINDLGVSI